MEEIVGDIEIDEENQVSDTEGWFKLNHLETKEEINERVKDVLRDLKEMHKQDPNQTILSISHGEFLVYLMSILTN